MQSHSAAYPEAETPARITQKNLHPSSSRIQCCALGRARADLGYVDKRPLPVERVDVGIAEDLAHWLALALSNSSQASFALVLCLGLRQAKRKLCAQNPASRRKHPLESCQLARLLLKWACARPARLPVCETLNTSNTTPSLQSGRRGAGDDALDRRLLRVGLSCWACGQRDDQLGDLSDLYAHGVALVCSSLRSQHL